MTIAATAGARAQPVIDRASPADLAMLAADRARGAPEQIGVVLVLDTVPGSGVAEARQALVDRIPAVPRLRQRLTRLPPGLGRPVWVDDPGFDPDHHVRLRHLDGSAGESALLDLATGLVTEHLPRARPLWSATFVVGTPDDRVGLVLVLHHAIADGIGGLAVLDQLLDGPGHPPVPGFPRAGPRAWQLALDAVGTALRTVLRLPEVSRELRSATAAGGEVRATRTAPSSLLRPTGADRRLAVAGADLDALRDAGHRHGGTVNDVLLAAVAGAIGALLDGRGERLTAVRTAVIAGSSASADRPGNRTAPLIISVPTDGTIGDRVRQIAGVVRTARTGTAGRAAAVVLQPLFHLAAATGLYRLYLRHQHRMHTLVSNVRGPRQPRRLGGLPVRDLIPLSVGEAGNLAVQFVALSYAGRLVVTVVADLVGVPDLDVLVRALQAELDACTPQSVG